MSPAPEFDAPLTLGAQLEARAAHPDVAERIALREGDRAWSYSHFRNEAVRTAHFLLERLAPIDDGRPGHVAMLLDNHLELLSLYAGCGYAGLTLFGINTGLRGDSLAGVVNQSRARILTGTTISRRRWGSPTARSSRRRWRSTRRRTRW